MAKTKISDLGSRRICVSDIDEKRIGALGNGVAKPGDVVAIVRSTGQVAGSDIGAFEFYEGIVDDNPDFAEDTAITAGVALSVIIPQSGHKYRVGVVDLGAACLEGVRFGFSATAGKLQRCAAIGLAGSVAHGICSGALTGANGDTVMEVRWG